MKIELRKWNEADFAAIGEIFTRCDRSFLTNQALKQRKKAGIWVFPISQITDALSQRLHSPASMSL